jgi:hypothetical protein
MAEAKRIAVIVRDRPAEALRVAGGLTLADDTIELFVLDRKLDKETLEIAQPLELAAELEMKMYSNNPENGLPRSRLRQWQRNCLSMT